MDTNNQAGGMPVQMENKSGKKVWIIAIIVAIVAVGAWLMMRSSDDAADTAATENSITVTDQNANSVSVVIDSVSLTVPGFIEIHADVNGAPGAYVGSSRVLTAGKHTSESIIMTTTPGAFYWAMLHSDDGNGLFDAAKDLPIKNAAGEVVMAKFQVKAAGLLNGEVDIKG